MSNLKTLDEFVKWLNEIVFGKEEKPKPKYCVAVVAKCDIGENRSLQKARMRSPSLNGKSTRIELLADQRDFQLE